MKLAELMEYSLACQPGWADDCVKLPAYDMDEYWGQVESAMYNPLRMLDRGPHHLGWSAVPIVLPFPYFFQPEGQVAEWFVGDLDEEGARRFRISRSLY